MQLEDIKKIGVVGAGTMGQGIAQISALAGYKVILYDLQSSALDTAKKNIGKNLDKGIERGKVTAEEKDQALSSIAFSTDFELLKADIIIEAIVERLDVKKELFEKLENQNSEKTILASNTSSIPITRIARDLRHPERFVGMHFFNPAHIMKLVEVISGVATSDDTSKVVYELAKVLGKVPVMAKDAPGFIVNRVARNFYVEGLKVLEEGVSDVKGIDRLVEASGFKMGPFRLMDLIGVDTNFSVTTSMFNAFHQDPKFRPSRIQEQKVDAGHHGRKSGKGFYDYSA
ncbi:3-hydroxybutyryl-CoA dehydrogenase [Roseivirga ehrenbergii]|uniref:3-hydroxybutyryl-CoA dehydrogenase n=2 Tax=Roseivirga ehrenbergii (strain DSM 102268 / JCM 13514 / KCTC 12282 / NCIMB 14502 / KMM 6017) TaxID=279360 RepID=A0A150XCB8_ROSEK|nr:3-hydroxyacyl-CoA dehydrogenase NAD-binding domain-containing protein [Roseivirga ehrenbergii]KYG76379.1 3-hydroxybutyryl-CoA dehydrogenase [Roseivirga ehrenbergii]